MQKYELQWILKVGREPGIMVHACNLSILGDRSKRTGQISEDGKMLSYHSALRPWVQFPIYPGSWLLTHT